MNILFIEDDPMNRRVVKDMLDVAGATMAEASWAEEGLARIDAETFDVILVDLRMPGTDGIAATAQLCGPGVSDPVPVLIITTFDIDEYLFGALEAGASGFLLKDAEPEVLVDAVRSVARGDGTLDNSLTRRVLQEMVSRRRTQPVVATRGVDVLTPREVDILLLLAQGMSNDEVAQSLFLEVSTVKSHLARMLPKLGVKSRLQAVVWAYQNGLVRVER